MVLPATHAAHSARGSRRPTVTAPPTPGHTHGIPVLTFTCLRSRPCDGGGDGGAPFGGGVGGCAWPTSCRRPTRHRSSCWRSVRTRRPRRTRASGGVRLRVRASSWSSKVLLKVDSSSQSFPFRPRRGSRPGFGPCVSRRHKSQRTCQHAHTLRARLSGPLTTPRLPRTTPTPWRLCRRLKTATRSVADLRARIKEKEDGSGPRSHPPSTQTTKYF